VSLEFALLGERSREGLSQEGTLMRQLLGAATDIVLLSAGSGEFPNQRK
jgi:hypothetical protein